MTLMRLELLSRHRIRDPGLGLNEPSGLTLNADGSALYTVSDDTKAIFRLDLQGRVSVSDTFFIALDDWKASPSVAMTTSCSWCRSRAILWWWWI
jgi:hypothetical protein